MNRLILLLLIVGACVLVGTVDARAGHTGYWFFTGHLPPSETFPQNQDRERHHPNQSPESATHYNRMSWAPCEHRMNHLLMHYNGNWTQVSAFPGGCDSILGIVPNGNHAEGPIRYGGCHNPTCCPGLLAQVWVNCRWGIGV